MKSKVFFFHYNKPASKVYNSPKMTVHYNKTCTVVDYIQCNVPTYTHHNKRQPHVVLKGKTKNISFIENSSTKKLTAIIN